ncbi:MAG: putative lipid II flippase FtsW [Bryobacterales bacterium]|nr:putative lipid II flippase FtsW [Bryobacterales bacterium]
MPLMLRFDRVLIWTILSMVLFGLLMVYSATASTEISGSAHFAKQLVAAVIGLALMYGLMFVNYRSLQDPRVVFAVLALAVLMLVVAAGLGTGANTRRFLRLGPLSLQPSELAKPALILFLAYHFERHREKMHLGRTLLAPVLVVSLLAGLIIAGRDFGTTACLVLLAGTLIFLAGVPIRTLASAALVAVALLSVFVYAEPYRVKRLLVFLDPDADPLGGGFQIIQSRIAVGSGGLLGQGWMAGKQKMDFLPEAHSDFMFAMVGEELGLIGTVLLVAGFAVIFWRGLRAATNAPDRFGFYLAAGVTVMIVSQAVLNMGVVLGMLPTKGMPLPFISYGGSSLWTTLAASGGLLSVSRSSQP